LYKDGEEEFSALRGSLKDRAKQHIDQLIHDHITEIQQETDEKRLKTLKNVRLAQ